MNEWRRFLPLCGVLAVVAVTWTACSSAQPPPTEQDVETGIRGTWERAAEPGMDGQTTVEIKSIRIGEPRQWNVLDGGNGRPDLRLWPVRVHWILRTHYRTRTAVTERNSVFSVHKNLLDEWVVGFSSDTGQTSRSWDEPPVAHGGV